MFENVDLFWNSVACWLTMSFLHVYLFPFGLVRHTVVVCVTFLLNLHSIYHVLMIGCLVWRQVFRFLVCFFFVFGGFLLLVVFCLCSFFSILRRLFVRACDNFVDLLF